MMSSNRFRLANPEQIQNPEQSIVDSPRAHAASASAYVGKSHTTHGSRSASPRQRPPGGRLPEPMYTSWQESENQIDKISTMQRLIRTSLNISSSRPSSPERSGRLKGDAKRLLLPKETRRSPPKRHQSPSRGHQSEGVVDDEEDSPRRHRRMSPLALSTKKKPAAPVAITSFNFSENPAAMPAVGGVCLGTRAAAALAKPMVPSSHPYSALSAASPVTLETRTTAGATLLGAEAITGRSSSKSTPASLRKSSTSSSRHASDGESTASTLRGERSRSGVFSGVRRGARIASNYLSSDFSTPPGGGGGGGRRPMKMRSGTVGHSAAAGIGKGSRGRSRTEAVASTASAGTGKASMQETMKLLAQEALNGSDHLKTVKHPHGHVHTDPIERNPSSQSSVYGEAQYHEESRVVPHHHHHHHSNGMITSANFGRRRSSAPNLLKNLTSFSVDSQDTQLSRFSDEVQVNADLHFSPQSHHRLSTISTVDSRGSSAQIGADVSTLSWSQSHTPDPYAPTRRGMTRSDDELSLCANLTGTSQTSEVTVIDKGPALMSSSLSLLTGEGLPPPGSLSSNGHRGSSRSVLPTRDLTSPSFEHRGSAFSSTQSASGSFYDRRSSNSFGGGGGGILSSNDSLRTLSSPGAHFHAPQRLPSIPGRPVRSSSAASSGGSFGPRGSGSFYESPRQSLTLSSTASIISIDLSPVDTLDTTNERAFRWTLREQTARRYFAAFLKQFNAEHYLQLVHECTDFENLVQEKPGERIMKFKKIWQQYFVDSAPSHIELSADIYDELYDAACACDRRQPQAPRVNIFDQVRDGAMRCIRMPFMKFLESDIYEEYDEKYSKNRPNAYALDWNMLDRMEKGQHVPKILKRDPSLYGNHLLEQGVPQKKALRIVEVGKAAKAGRLPGSKPPTPSGVSNVKGVNIPAGAISVTDSMAITSVAHEDEGWLYSGDERELEGAYAYRRGATTRC